MFAIIALNEQTAKLLQKKRVNLYGMHPIFSGGGASRAVSLMGPTNREVRQIVGHHQKISRCDQSDTDSVG
jgi:hypothetical protein